MRFDYRLLKRRIRKVFGTEDKLAEAMGQKPASITLRQKAFRERVSMAQVVREIINKSMKEESEYERRRGKEK